MPDSTGQPDINGGLSDADLIRQYAPGRSSSTSGPLAGINAKPLFDLGDAALAIPRGIVGAGKDLYGLADTLTGDALPDWKSNPFGESTSTIGSLVENASNFAVGFVPIAGWLGRAGKIQKILGTASELEKGLETASVFDKGLKLAKAAEEGGFLKSLTGASVRRNALASAVTGFALFDGHEERLSNMLAKAPGIQQPIFDFLSAKADDPQLLGRMKNAIEQAGMGVAFDAIFLGLKGLKAARAVREAGGTAEEAHAAQVAAAPPEQVRAALKNIDDDGVSLQGPPHPHDVGAQRGPPSPFDESGVPLGSQQAERMEARRQADLATRLANPDTEANRAFLAEAKAKYPDLSDVEAMKAYGAEGPTAVGPSTVPFSPEEAAARAKLASTGIPGTPEYQPPKLPEIPQVENDPANVLRALGLNEAKVQRVMDVAKEKAALGVEDPANLNPREVPASERLALGLEKSDLNLEPFASPEGVVSLLRAGHSLFRDTIEQDIKSLAPQTLDQMDQEAFKHLSDLTGASEDALAEQLTRRVAKNADAIKEVRAELLFDRAILKAQGTKTANLIRQYQDIRQGRATGDPLSLIVQVQKNTQLTLALEAGVQGQGAEMGRTFRAMQRVGTVDLPTFDSLLHQDPAEMARRVEKMGGYEALDKLMNRQLAAYGDGGVDGAAKLAALNRGTRLERAGRMTLEWWMNSILGNPHTGVVNILGSAMNIIYNPLERLFGSAVAKRFDGSLTRMADAAKYDAVGRQALGQFQGLVHGFGEFIGLVKQSYLGKELELIPRDLPEATALRFAPQITAKNAAAVTGIKALETSEPIAAAINWFGGVFRLPSEVMGRTDEVFKQFTFRKYLESEFTNEALNLGKTSAEEVSSHVVERMNKAMYENQIRTAEMTYAQGLKVAESEGIIDEVAQAKRAQDFLKTNFDETAKTKADRAFTHAQDVTFNTPARDGTITKSIQKMIAAHPMLKAIAPFINTPANLIKFTGQRLDAIGLAKYILSDKKVLMGPELEAVKSRFLRDMLSGDVQLRSEAIGRLSAGAVFTASALSAAYSGVITGAGPKDPEARQALMAGGWLPYSIKTPSGYIQFSRLDPFATFFGLAADTLETYRHSAEEDSGGLTAVVHGLATAMAYNFTNKSYLSGLKHTLDLFSDPVKNAGPYVRQFSSAIVPGYVKAATGAFGDGNARDVKTMLDSVRANIPGASDFVPVQRNVLGEPVKRVAAIGTEETGGLADFLLPIAYRKTSDSAVSTEMARLGYPFSPPRRIINGLDLSTVPQGKTTAYDRWGELHGTVTIGGRNIQEALNRTIASPAYQALEPNSKDGLVSPRIAKITAVIREYRAKAWTQLLNENKTLKDHDREYTANKIRLRHGLSLSILPEVETR